MAAAGDLRDIMDMPHEGPRKPAPKKARGGPQQRLSGISKEVYSLMGDSVPPIPLVETPKYKSRPAYAPRAFKPRKWESREFIHGARNDNLVLRHWRHGQLPATKGSSMPPQSDGITPTDSEIPTDQKSVPAKSTDIPLEEDDPMVKYNVKVQVASYDDEQYEKYFKSEDWTRQETDFLMSLCRELDLRWVLIADRYIPEEIPPPTTQEDHQASGDTDAMAVDTVQTTKKTTYPDRTMEALKSRYYTIAAKMLETHTPANDMTQSEFQLWEKMRNFDAKTESMRKMLAEKLFERTKDEAEEEKILLEELQRITKNEEEFLLMRRDLYSRLEPPPTMRRNGEEQSTAMYQTSSGLSALLQNLLAREKKFKRPSIMPGGPDGGHGSSSATPGLDADGQPKKQKWEKGQHPNQYTRRDTMDTQNSETGPLKKGSQSGPNIRILTAAEELKFGVSRPQERLTSGVQFRHEKVHRLVTGKSAVQMQKYQAALVELGIPTRLVMPTDKICKEFERLITEIQVLLDARKTREKVTAEIKVLEEQRRIRLGLPKEEGTQENADVSKTEVDAPDDEAEDGTAPADISMMTNDDADMEDDINNIDADADGDGQEENEEENEAEGDNEEENDDQNEDEDDERAVVEEDSDADEESKAVNGHEVDDSAGSDQEEVEEEVEEEEDDEDDEPSLPNSEDEAVDSDKGDDDDDDERNAREEADSEEQGSGVPDDPGEFEEAGEDSDAPSPAPRPASAHSATSRLHKRSASVISEASKAGSNRSAAGRKKRK